MLNWRYIKSLPQGLLQVKTTAVKIAGLIKWVLDEARELMLTSDGMLHLYHPDSGVQLNVCFLNESGWFIQIPYFCTSYSFYVYRLFAPILLYWQTTRRALQLGTMAWCVSNIYAFISMWYIIYVYCDFMRILRRIWTLLWNHRKHQIGIQRLRPPSVRTIRLNGLVHWHSIKRRVISKFQATSMQKNKFHIFAW